MDDGSIEKGPASRPEWEHLEEWLRGQMQGLIQDLLEQEVAECAPRSAKVENSRYGARPGVGRWLGKQARRSETEPCLKPSRQCGGGHPTRPCAASQSVVMVTKETAD